MAQAELFVAMYVILTGFICSGLIGTFYQLFRTEPVGFSVDYSSITGGVTGVFLCIFAGPFIIMRNTIRARQIENRAIGWVVAASALASLWSFCTGIMILHLFLSITSSI